MKSRSILEILITRPDNSVCFDCRPGHSLGGLFYAMDPFQNVYNIPLRRVSLWIDKTCANMLKPQVG